ncbi:MAG: serine protease [Sandaracinaceae bacterium]
MLAGTMLAGTMLAGTMPARTMLARSMLLMAALSVAGLLGCATTTPPPPRPASRTVSAPDVPSVLDPAMSELHVQCRDRFGPCPSSVGLFVRRDGDDLERCTAALIGHDTVLTASHCLPIAARRAGASCRGAWIGFVPNEAPADTPAEWVECRTVERADAVDDREVMRRDVAVLRLHHALARTPVPIDGSAPREGSIVTVVSVRPHPIYRSQSELEARLCRVASTPSAELLFGPAASEVGWLMECPSYPGNSGSPVLDGDGRLRAMLHAGSNASLGVAVLSALE